MGGGGLKWSAILGRPNIEDKRSERYNPDRSFTHRGINRMNPYDEKSLPTLRVDMVSRLGDRIFQNLGTRLEKTTLQTAVYINKMLIRFKEEETVR